AQRRPRLLRGDLARLGTLGEPRCTEPPAQPERDPGGDAGGRDAAVRRRRAVGLRTARRDARRAAGAAARATPARGGAARARRALPAPTPAAPPRADGARR